MIDRKLLGIYMNDHLAGATAGVELARRARSSNRDSDFGPALERLAEEIAEDRETLTELMDTLELPRDRAKVAAAWTGEKLGRLKLNGRLFGYSPLSRLIELEALTLGVTGKRLLWIALRHVAALDSRLSTSQLDELIARAESQIQLLEEHRTAAAGIAIAATEES